MLPINSTPSVFVTSQIMSTKIVAFSAIVASAVAFSPSASFQPRLRTGTSAVSMAMDKSGRAPVITVFDHRGCKRGTKDSEYKGVKVGTKDDEMCIKVQVAKITALNAESVLQQTISVLKK